MSNNDATVERVIAGKDRRKIVFHYGTGIWMDLSECLIVNVPADCEDVSEYLFMYGKGQVEFVQIGGNHG